MMPTSRGLKVDGKYWGTVYTFEKEGDEFPVHVHEEEDNHITMLVFGGIRCMGHPKHDGVEVYTQPGGIILDWIAGEPHGFIALVDGTTIVNLQKAK